jgi:hypothetical protein
VLLEVYHVPFARNIAILLTDDSLVPRFVVMSPNSLNPLLNTSRSALYTLTDPWS